jgi:hypothetical protein
MDIERGLAMSSRAIIEVHLDDNGTFTYKLRETDLSTKAYAQLLVALATDIAEMFETASDHKFRKEDVYAQIIHFMQESFYDNPPSTNLGMLQ